MLKSNYVTATYIDNLHMLRNNCKCRTLSILYCNTLLLFIQGFRTTFVQYWLFVLCSVVLKEKQLEDTYLAVEEEDEKTPNVFSSDWLPPKKDKKYTFKPFLFTSF